MPNCFTLTPKNTTEPATLAAVDEAICRHLGVEVHPTKYFAGWYDDLGWGFAMGKTPAELVARCIELLDKTTDPEEIKQLTMKLRIAKFLDDYYTVNAWAEIGRR